MKASGIVGVTRRLPSPVIQHLQSNFETILNDSDEPLSRIELLEMAADVDGLLCTVTDKIDAELINHPNRRFKMIANFGAGVDHIDLAAAQAGAVSVSNTPDQLTGATADLTIALILMTVRGLGEAERKLRAGEWRGWAPDDIYGHDLSGKALGIIGLGRIGMAVAKRAAIGLGLRVTYFSRRPPDQDRDRRLEIVPSRSLEELLHGSDIISLHLPADAANRHLLNRDRLALIPRGGYLINTSRGSLVDTLALIEQLKAGRLAGAGLDVYENEPRIHPELMTLPNIVLLPHAGSATVETRIAMGLRAAANLQAFFAGDRLLDPVV